MPDTIKLDANHPADLEKAASLLLAGHIVAVPTETVYGLAADASNEQAVKKVFEAKQRPVGHPLIVHVASHDRIRLWVDPKDYARMLYTAMCCLAGNGLVNVIDHTPYFGTLGHTSSRYGRLFSCRNH